MNEHLSGLDQHELDEQELLEEQAEETVATILENVPEEKQEELAEKVQELVEKNSEPKSVLGSMEGLKNLFAMAVPMHHGQATKTHNPERKRGVGITRKDKSPIKSKRTQSKKSRKINRGK